MACYRPLRGYRSRRLSPSGKRAVVFKVADGWADLPVSVPCGQCIGCRLERSRQWAMRCVHEAELYEENCFVTLTYRDECLPPGGSLDKTAFPGFMKRMRSRFAGRRVRYFHCGEYGERNGRPHYHALLFNFDFADKYAWAQRGGRPSWRSETLESLWPFGQCEIGSVSFESAAYVARYVVKKLSGAGSERFYRRVDEDTGEVFQLTPEFVTMSRRPGIGRGWFEKFAGDVYPSDEVVMRGRAMKPPRYYDRILEAEDREAFSALHRRRVVHSDERLQDMEAFAVSKLETFGGRKV